MTSDTSLVVTLILGLFDKVVKLDLGKLCEFCIKSCVGLRKVEEQEQIAIERSVVSKS